MEEPSSRPRSELQVRYYPRRVRPGAGSGDLTPSQAVRLVEQAGRTGASDEPRAYTDPKPAAAAPVPPPPPARRSWWARLRSRLRR